MPEAPLDVTGRPTALRDLDLDIFFHPKSVAVIGASDTGSTTQHRHVAEDPPVG